MRIIRLLKPWLAGTVVCLLLFGSPIASAVSANISHSYQATTPVSNGELVSLTAGKSNYVELANLNNSSRLLGVAVPSKDSLIAIDANSTETQVATSGTASALVTTLNGNISVGDQVGVSPFDGVGMKALTDSYIIGVAETSFNASTSGAVKESVKNQTGKTKEVWEGYVQVSLAVSNNSIPTKGQKLDFLQTIAKSLTGRTISTFRIIMSFVVIILALVALITIIYSAIYSSLMSIGRNPLAKASIIKSLIYVTFMTILLTGMTTVAVSFLLR